MQVRLQLFYICEFLTVLPWIFITLITSYTRKRNYTLEICLQKVKDVEFKEPEVEEKHVVAEEAGEVVMAKNVALK